MSDDRDFNPIKLLRLASPEMIRSWSYGEVKKPETMSINRRHLLVLEKDGLFCERIFGTTKDWQCYCGKFNTIDNKGVKCDRCGVEVTNSEVRNKRMGHIELASPVSHIWYYRAASNPMGLLLDLAERELWNILYYKKYIVLEPGKTNLKFKQILTEDEYNQFQERFGDGFIAEMGAGAIKTLLKNLVLDSLSEEFRKKKTEKNAESDKKLLDRIRIIEDFRTSEYKPEWMIMDVIPVIPPGMRQMVYRNNCFETTGLNILYQRVIKHNNSLRNLSVLNSPDIIIRNEKRMLQESVDALYDNSKNDNVLKWPSPPNGPLESLYDMFKDEREFEIFDFGNDDWKDVEYNNSRLLGELSDENKKKLDTLFLDIQSALNNAEKLLTQDIELVMKEFNLRPRYGVKENGIQDINKNLSENLSSVKFWFFYREFYKIDIDKSIHDRESFVFLLEKFQRENGYFSAAFLENNEDKSLVRYVGRKQLGINSILIEFGERIYPASQGPDQEDGKDYSLSISLYNISIAETVQSKLKNYEPEIEWFNSLEDSYLSNIIESAIPKEIDFIKKMKQMKLNHTIPSYNQIMWLKNICAKYKEALQ
jgi:hypothetical protein